MTPKQKAIELFDKFNKPDTTHYPYIHNAQQCALIAVDEIIASNPIIFREDNSIMLNKSYWQEVKQEIETL